MVEAKYCRKCRLTKSLSEFGRHARRPDGLRDHCRECARKPARTVECGLCAASFDHRGRGPAPKLCVTCEVTSSWCHECGAAKPHDQFHRLSTTRTGCQSRCIACTSTRYVERGGRQRSREANLRRYGMTVEDFDEMIIDQRGRCGICEEQLSGAVAVDHDHVTGEVRGLLCYGCNTGLGALGDDIDGLMRAAAYVLSHANVLEMI